LTPSNFPTNVELFSTTRYFDANSYSDFNLATHVGDNLDTVRANRALLAQHYQLPSKPKYLEQVHSNICLNIPSAKCVGDAQTTKNKNTVCAILTADCLPIFISNKSGTQVGVVHAGWKGIISGVIESTIAQFDNAKLLVHFGPAISQIAFEVGDDVYQQFINKNPKLSQVFIKKSNKYQLDIYQAAKIILNNLGIKSITGGNECTFTQKDKYFSYRRDGTKSGRMAHFIWFS